MWTEKTLKQMGTKKTISNYNGLLERKQRLVKENIDLRAENMRLYARLNIIATKHKKVINLLKESN